MTRSDWQSLKVQFETGLLSSQIHRFVEKTKNDKLQELLRADMSDTATHEQLIGELRVMHTVLPGFKIFVENQIRDSKEEEQ